MIQVDRQARNGSIACWIIDSEGRNVVGKGNPIQLWAGVSTAVARTWSMKEPDLVASSKVVSEGRTEVGERTEFKLWESESRSCREQKSADIAASIGIGCRCEQSLQWTS